MRCADRCRSMLGIQLAVTACLSVFTKGEAGEKLHPRILSAIVKADLDAMEEFRNHKQLQKNVLLTICNDKILQEVSFDKYRCARLVMDCLVTYHDTSMNRMSVAICSILGKLVSFAGHLPVGHLPVGHLSVGHLPTPWKFKWLMKFAFSCQNNDPSDIFARI